MPPLSTRNRASRASTPYNWCRQGGEVSILRHANIDEKVVARIKTIGMQATHAIDTGCTGNIDANLRIGLQGSTKIFRDFRRTIVGDGSVPGHPGQQGKIAPAHGNRPTRPHLERSELLGKMFQTDTGQGNSGKLAADIGQTTRQNDRPLAADPPLDRLRNQQPGRRIGP